MCVSQSRTGRLFFEFIVGSRHFAAEKKSSIFVFRLLFVFSFRWKLLLLRKFVHQYCQVLTSSLAGKRCGEEGSRHVTIIHKFILLLLLLLMLQLYTHILRIVAVRRPNRTVFVAVTEFGKGFSNQISKLLIYSYWNRTLTDRILPHMCMVRLRQFMLNNVCVTL